MEAPQRADCLTDEQISQFVEGVLAPEKRGVVERHIAECAACGQLAAAVASGSAQRSTDGKRVADAPLARGARVGRYEILDWLGAGAMGTVYSANDPALDRKVALKLIRAQVAGPDLEARLLREAKAMARLSHPDVITVHDAGRDGDRLFIAMELVDGGTLRDWLDASPRTSREILAVYARAGRGLAQAHAAGIIHRDFKPDNVLVGADGRVRVTDFGLARAEHANESSDPDLESAIDPEARTLDASLTRTGAVVGTPVYMAPEQLAGTGADARSDVYSFCVALYEALYGARPFAGSTMREILAAKRADAVRPAPSKSKVSPRLRRALLVGLRARPEARYASMTAALDALERAARTPKLPFVAGATIVAGAAIAFVMASKGPAVMPSSVSSATTPSASAAAAMSGAAAAACASHRACVESHGGAAYVCRAADKTCVPIASDDCTARFEPNDLVGEDTLWIGAMFPLKGPAALAYGNMNIEGVELARKELAQATRSLEGSNASLRVRRIALVACDDSKDPMRAARHLVDDVGVPAILGFGSGQEVVDVAGSLLISRGVLSVATLTPSPLITRLPQPPGLPPMVWRTTFSLDDVANATAQMFHDVLTPRLNPRPPTMKAALTRDDTASTLSFAEMFSKRFVMNGKSALDNGKNYVELKVVAGARAESEIERIADRLTDVAPSFVVLFNALVTAVPIVERVEARWPVGTPRPTYVVPNESLRAFSAYLGNDVDRRRRLFAIQSDSSSSANARFVMRYNDAHENQVGLTVNPSVSYDAFYVLAYAAFALEHEPITGASLARAFGRLVPPGRPVEVGPTHVFDALRGLAAGGRIDLQGAASGLDFDLTTGEAPSDFALLCAGVGADGGVTGDDIESGVVFRARTRRIDGAMRCP